MVDTSAFALLNKNVHTFFSLEIIQFTTKIVQTVKREPWKVLGDSFQNFPHSWVCGKCETVNYFLGGANLLIFAKLKMKTKFTSQYTFTIMLTVCIPCVINNRYLLDSKCCF